MHVTDNVFMYTPQEFGYFIFCGMGWLMFLFGWNLHHRCGEKSIGIILRAAGIHNDGGDGAIVQWSQYVQAMKRIQQKTEDIKENFREAKQMIKERAEQAKREKRNGGHGKGGHGHGGHGNSDLNAHIKELRNKSLFNKSMREMGYGLKKSVTSIKALDAAGAGKKLVKGVGTGVNAVGSKVNKARKSVASGLLGMSSTVGGELGEIGEDAIDGIRDGIRGGIDAIEEIVHPHHHTQHRHEHDGPVNMTLVKKALDVKRLSRLQVVAGRY
jgi:hypothetical protein